MQRQTDKRVLLVADRVGALVEVGLVEVNVGGHERLVGLLDELQLGQLRGGEQRAEGLL